MSTSGHGGRRVGVGVLPVMPGEPPQPPEAVASGTGGVWLDDESADQVDDRGGLLQL
ncbi:hypothetical protein ACPXB5_03435 [Micromonospora arida]|uniref:hypothetical protein n=1 Tax=Micromonospora arida TaxID=2203715 RepID=UPI003CFB938E